MPNFQLDGETIITRLGQKGFNGTIEAELSVGQMREIMGLKEPGKVQVTFQKGHIQHCRIIIGQRQQAIPPSEMSSFFARAGVLHWQLHMHTTNTDPIQTFTPPPQPAVAAVSPSSIPFHLRSVPINQIQDVTIRKVYQLIDGQRSVMKIAQLCRLSVDVTILIINQLRAQYLVDIRR